MGTVKKGAEKDQWESALEYFRKRRSVVFLSYCRFWEQHGFVQQSLAYALAESGVEVRWLDGADWRPYRPVVRKQNAHLKVTQLPSVPMRRLPFLDAMDLKRKSRYVKKLLKKLPGDPVIWVEAGIDERLAGELEKVDIFSVFDDPYRHLPSGSLCQKARVIVCQNPKALDCVKLHAHKSHILLPPVDMNQRVFEESKIELPEGFPKTILGYIGSFSSDGFDLVLFEEFIRSYPQYGFLLVGRTNAEGLAAVEKFKQYRNFIYFPWMERSQLASLWQKLSLTLLFYRPNRTQDGAFPVKIVESLYFSVPCIATDVPKTESLEGVFPRGKTLQSLKEALPEALGISKENCRKLYFQYFTAMDPYLHLARVAELLSAKT